MAERFRITSSRDNNPNDAENNESSTRPRSAKRASHRKSRRPENDAVDTHAITSQTELSTTRSRKPTTLKKSSASDSNLKLSSAARQHRHSHRKSRRVNGNTDDNSRYRHSTRKDEADLLTMPQARRSSRRHSHRHQQQVDDSSNRLLNVTTPNTKVPQKSRTKSRSKRKSTAGDTTPSIIFFNADIGEPVNTSGPLALPRSVTNSRRPSVTSRRASPTNILGSSAPLRAASASKLNDGGGKTSKPRKSRNESDRPSSRNSRTTGTRRPSRRKSTKSRTNTSSFRPASSFTADDKRHRRNSSTYDHSSRNPSIIRTTSRRNARRLDSPTSNTSLRYNLPKPKRSASRRRPTRRKTRRIVDDNKPATSSASSPSLLTAAINTEYEKCLPEAVQDIYQILHELGYSLSIDPGSPTTAETFVAALTKQTVLLRSAVAETEAKCQLLQNEKALVYDKTDRLQSSIYYLEKSIEKHAHLLQHKQVKADSIRHDKQQIEHLTTERIAEADIEFDKRKRVLRQRAREREQASKQLNQQAEQLAACVEQLRAQTADDEAKFAFITKRLGQWTTEKQQMRQVVCDLRARAQQEQTDHEEMQQKLLNDYATLDDEFREIKEREQCDAEKAQKARQVYEAQLEHLQTQQQHGVRDLSKATEQLECIGLQYEQALSKAKHDMIAEFEKLYARVVTDVLDSRTREDVNDTRAEGRAPACPFSDNSGAKRTSLFNSPNPSPANLPRLSADPSSPTNNHLLRPASAREFPRPSFLTAAKPENDLGSKSTPVIAVQDESRVTTDGYESRNDTADEQQTPDVRFDKMRSLADKTEALIQELNRRMFNGNQNRVSEDIPENNTVTTDGTPTPPAFSSNPTMAPEPDVKVSNFLRTRLNDQQPPKTAPSANDRNDEDLASVGTYTLLNQQQRRSTVDQATSNENYATFSARLPPQPSSNRFSVTAESQTDDRKSNNHSFSYFLPLRKDTTEDERRRSSSRKSSTRNFSSFVAPSPAPDTGRNSFPQRPSKLPPSFLFPENRLNSTSRSRTSNALQGRLQSQNRTAARQSTRPRVSLQSPPTRCPPTPCPRYRDACNPFPPHLRNSTPPFGNNLRGRRNVSRLPRTSAPQQACPSAISRNSTPLNNGVCDEQKYDAIAKIRAAAAAEEHRLSLGKAATDEHVVDKSSGGVARHIEMLLRKYPCDVRQN